MSEAANELSLIRKYLLGSLEGEEREQLEERVMSDADFRDKVLLVEETLIEDYADGALDETEQQIFRKMFYANPQRRIEVRIVEGLQQQAATTWWTRFFGASRKLRRSPRATLGRVGASSFDPLSALRKPPVAVALVLAVAIAFFVVQWWLRSAPAPPLLTEAQQRHDLIERELARLNRSPESQALPSVAATLSPGLSRGDDTQRPIEFPKITLPQGVQSVQLRLLPRPSGTEYRSFQALLSALDGRDTYKVDVRLVEMSPGVPAIILTLPAHLLEGGDYSVQLSGQSAGGQLEALPDHYYYFRLVRP